MATGPATLVASFTHASHYGHARSAFLFGQASQLAIINEWKGDHTKF